MWLPCWNAAIFIHGCFWHVHECRTFRWPETREVFWRKKLQRNKERDTTQLAKLKELDIRTLIVWECAIRRRDSLGPAMAARLAETWLRSEVMTAEIDTDGLHMTDC